MTLIVATESSSFPLDASSCSAVLLSDISMLLRGGKMCLRRKPESPSDSGVPWSSASISFLSKLMKLRLMASSDSSS